MADIYMHERLAEAVMKKRSIKEYQAEFKLGSQGPDPLYYVIFSKDFKFARSIGDRLHDTKTNHLFDSMVEHLKKNYSDALYAYIQGFFLHFALDTRIHPYVYHHVGVYNPEDASTHAMRGLHLKFERSIDKQLIFEDYHQKAVHYNWLRGVPKIKSKEALINLYDDVVKNTLGIEHAGRLYWRGVKGMRRTIRWFMKDRFGLKKKLYRMFDKRYQTQDIFYQDMSLYGDNLAFDFLNREQRTWFHPITNESSNDSVDQLFTSALKDAMDYLDILEHCLKSGQSFDSDNVIKNRSFNSGIDCDDQRPMRFFNLFKSFSEH